MKSSPETEHKALLRWVEAHASGQDGPGADLVALVEQLVAAAGDEVGPVLFRVRHALEALSRIRAERAAIEATILLPLVVGNGQAGNLPEETSDEVRRLLEQLATLDFFGRTYLPHDQHRAEGLRQLLMALVADVRVVLIALAWQIAHLRSVDDADPAVRREVARETQLIHAPLANRLGVWQLKWELEDLSFRFLEPNTYQRISRLVAERQADRQAFIERFISELRQRVSEAGIDGEITGRAKHIYSIWRKMQRKGLDFHELFDVRAVRVLVDTVEQCYAVLGMVHTHWQPVPGEFDDYITNPKPNLYRSLHTAVATDSGRVVEVQIRTHEMHRHAELGVAAHWRYKEGGGHDESLDRRVQMMRQLLESEGGEDDASLMESFQNLTTEDRVYVLTPGGEVKDLAAGATPLDFAYLIHTEVGHRCRGARVNGRIVPLTTELKNGDRVEILTGKQPHPSRDWLVPRLGYLNTARARGKVRTWFRQANQEENQAAGRQAVESEFRRLDLEFDEIGRVVQKFNASRVEDLLEKVGAGDITAAQVANAVERLHQREQQPETELAVHKPPQRRGEEDDVRIEGVGSLMHQMARCCQPVPGDEIAGYITRGRGVSIHRQDCRQFLALQRRHPERVLDVYWSTRAQGRYPARICIEAWDRRDLIRDIGTLLASERVNVSAMNARHAEGSDSVEMDLTVQVEDFDQLAVLLTRLQGIPNVTSARRLR
ncbi:bifunctional (p)ppGpp synthetase/guanosine-3',5'-bis(diphosphate) 3'-pyrophosphohydrolase [Wenzhouxiangella sp. AB-CW3]|uniref:RelA/SpoT family protein n=1 Tax=Wenzhouxiangella sp. AB-CW3 TaxID=2771012 RepID=UPI00168B199E|nr:bifunctional (p)ppGpp synthetase/guanosine-3',5'-bis(diphosphate) 3'-pyrophosphohydrolase [Wenzhouxiangella sp. AB-CW3]QOC21896.1 bifunctional (p)ppGpp synthetase/guanosine-3',5'-bis(diphosphate) 3'-pyrophosphohydrolase [Wenzhouxiangella sp. AB-CW3]